MPGNLPPNWWASPNLAAGYTTDKLYAFLASYVPKYEPGKHYEYANVGFALLGIALLARLLQTRSHTSLAGTDVVLGWVISSDERAGLIWKSGLTGGFNTFIGFSVRRRRGALVLSNFLWDPIDAGTIELGMKLISPGFHPDDLDSLYR